jgi:outer membrane protein assembly factor BamB
MRHRFLLPSCWLRFPPSCPPRTGCNGAAPTSTAPPRKKICRRVQPHGACGLDCPHARSSGATPWSPITTSSSRPPTTPPSRASPSRWTARTGREAWRVKVTDGVGQDRQSTYSNPSPVTDGTRSWFLFATGDLVCLDAAGKEVWRHNIQKLHGQFAYQWTYGASPLLFDGRLYVRSSSATNRSTVAAANRATPTCSRSIRHRQGALESGASRSSPRGIPRGLLHSHALYPTLAAPN